MNHDSKVHHSVETEMEFTVVKPRDERPETLVDVDKTYKNHQGDITANNGDEAIKNYYGMFVENLEYDSDDTVELSEDENEIFNYETFMETVEEEEEDDEDDAMAGDTVEDKDEVVQIA
jgi:hypothetical protein